MQTEEISLVWREELGRDHPAGSAEEALYCHLLHLSTTCSNDNLVGQLRTEIQEKKSYMDPSWGYIDCSNIGKLTVVT